MLKNNASGYGWPMKVLHWVIAIMVILQYFYILMKNYSPEDAPIGIEWMMIHKASGFIIFWLAILFVLWRLCNRKPDWPMSMAGWQKHLANIAHLMLYILIVLMPLSGILMGGLKGYPINFFNIQNICLSFLPKSEAWAGVFHSIHLYSVWLLGAFIILHIAGALTHHFIYKDDVLKRMM